MGVDDVAADVTAYLIEELWIVDSVAEHVVDRVHSTLVAEAALPLEVHIINICSFHAIIRLQKKCNSINACPSWIASP